MCIRDRNVIFYIIAYLVFVMISSSAMVCNFCGREVEIRDADSASDSDSNGAFSEKIEEDVTIKEDIYSCESISDSEKSQEMTISTPDTTVSKPVEPAEKSTVILDDRFVLVIETMQPRSDQYCYAKGNDPSFNEMCKYFTEQLKIPPEQQFICWGQDENGGTYDNFISAVKLISRTSNKDCTVMVFLMSHGSPDDEANNWPASIEFADGKGNEHGGAVKTYTEISKLLDRISCAMMTVTVSSCALNDSVEPLTDDPAFPRAAMAPITMQEIFNYIFTDSKKVDEDKNGTVSFKDVYDFVHDTSMPINLGRYEDMKYRDDFGVGSKVIFG